MSGEMAAPASPTPRGAEEDLRPPVVAVDCNGADRGPAEVAAGALIAASQGVRVILFGPSAALQDAVGQAPGVEVVDAPAEALPCQPGELDLGDVEP